MKQLVAEGQRMYAEEVGEGEMENEQEYCWEEETDDDEYDVHNC